MYVRYVKLGGNGEVLAITGAPKAGFTDLGADHDNPEPGSPLRWDGTAVVVDSAALAVQRRAELEPLIVEAQRQLSACIAAPVALACQPALQATLDALVAEYIALGA